MRNILNVIQDGAISSSEFVSDYSGQGEYLETQKNHLRPDVAK